MQAWNKGKKIAGVIITCILAVILLLNVYNIVQRNFLGNPNPKVAGFSNAVVVSGSMEPAIMTNDLVILHEEDEYQVGDIIMFPSEDHFVTHRIVKVTEEGFITRGDANNTDDFGIVPKELVEGKVVVVVPHFGALIQFLHTPLGMLILILIVAVLLGGGRLQGDRKKGVSK